MNALLGGDVCVDDSREQQSVEGQEETLMLGPRAASVSW